MRFINWIDSEFMTLQGIKFDQMHENQIHQFDENKIHHSDKSENHQSEENNHQQDEKIYRLVGNKFINRMKLNLSNGEGYIQLIE